MVNGLSRSPRSAAFAAGDSTPPPPGRFSVFHGIRSCALFFVSFFAAMHVHASVFKGKGRFSFFLAYGGKLREKT